MLSTHLRQLAALTLLVVGLAGCGSGADEGGMEVRVTVTRDFGARQLEARIVQNLSSSETAVGLLQRSFDVETGESGSLYVNGVESDPGDADVKLHDGDRIWWDRHDSSAAHVPAVVGAFPEPFAHGAGGKRYPVVLACADDVEEACDTVSGRLARVGVTAARQTLGTGSGERTVRVLVGRWVDLRADHALAQIVRGPDASGVFAHFPDLGKAPYDGKSVLELFDARGDPISEIHTGAGLVAATRFEEQAPTWVITGTDAAGVKAAASALDERTLRGRFAIAVMADGSPERVFPLPTTQ